MEEKVMGTETVEETVEMAGTVTEETAESGTQSADDAAKHSNRTADNKRNRKLDYFINKVENPDTREYIRTRVEEEMEYYSRESRKCKKNHQNLAGLNILLGALIPLFSILSDSSVCVKLIIAGLGSAVTAINAFQSLYNYKDIWLTYRNTRETLLRTLYYYFNHTGSFGPDKNGKEKTQEELDKLLIQCCEKELASENGSWRSIVEE